MNIKQLQAIRRNYVTKKNIDKKPSGYHKFLQAKTNLPKQLSKVDLISKAKQFGFDEKASKVFYDIPKGYLVLTSKENGVKTLVKEVHYIEVSMFDKEKLIDKPIKIIN